MTFRLSDAFVAHWLLDPDLAVAQGCLSDEALARLYGPEAMRTDGKAEQYALLAMFFMQEKLIESKLYPVFVGVEMPSAVTLAGIEAQGIFVAPEKWNRANRKAVVDRMGVVENMARELL
jgi:hypothetical protein